MIDAEEIEKTVAEITATVVAKPRAGRDPVNQPTINNWVEALGDTNPIYRDEAAGVNVHTGGGEVELFAIRHSSRGD